jgi:hypothetical protein
VAPDVDAAAEDHVEVRRLIANVEDHLQHSA